MSLEASGSYIATTYPQWHIAGTGTNAYLRLSGTSMAAGVVSGGVALLLNAEPSLTPAQVKVALQTGARFIPSAGLIAGGTGSVDFAQSLKIADQGLIAGAAVDACRTSSGCRAARRSSISGTLIDRVYDRTGIRLLGLLDLDALLGGADGAESGVLSLLGLSNPIGQTPANYVVWGTRRRLDVAATTSCGARRCRIRRASTSSGARQSTMTTWSGARSIDPADDGHVMAQPAATPARPAALRAYIRSGVCRRLVPLRVLRHAVSPATDCRSSGGCSPR